MPIARTPAEAAYVKNLPKWVRDRIWNEEQARHVWSGENIVRRQQQALCRMIARNVRVRGYWPTLAQIQRHSFRRRGKTNHMGDKKSYDALVLCATDLVSTGHLKVLHGIQKVVALTDKGWHDYTPYAPVEPTKSSNPSARKKAQSYDRMAIRAVRIHEREAGA